MDLTELLELLGLEEPEEFSDFDHLAGLIEHEGPVEEAALFRLLRDIEGIDLADLIGYYFEDLLTGVADDAIEFYTLLSLIGRSLAGQARQSEPDSEERQRFVSELICFRDWIGQTEKVSGKANGSGPPQMMTILEAMALYRLAQLGETDYQFDYSEVSNYPLDEYALAFAEVIGADDDDDDQPEL